MADIGVQGDTELETLSDKYVRNQISMDEIRRLRSLTKDDPKYLASLYQRRQMFAKSQRGSRDTARGGVIPVATGDSVRSLPGLNNALYQANMKNGLASPGGFKKSGRDQDSQVRRAGGVTNQADGFNTVKFAKDGSAAFGHRDAFGNFVVDQKLTRGQVDSIMKRGASGATLSTLQQSVYDRSIKMRESAAIAEQQRKAEQKAAEAAEKKRLEKIDEERRKSDIILGRQREIAKMNADAASRRQQMSLDAAAARNQATIQARENAAAIKARKDQAQIDRLREMGVDAPETLSKQDRDAIAGGRKKWDYDERTKRRKEDIDNAYYEELESGIYGPEDEDRLRGQYESEIAKLRKSVVAGDQEAEDKRKKEVEARSRYAMDYANKKRTAYEKATEEYINGSGANGQLNMNEKGEVVPFNLESAIDEGLATYDTAMRKASTPSDEYSPEFSMNEWADGSWQYGGSYEEDVAHGYPYSYEEWLAQFGGMQTPDQIDAQAAYGEHGAEGQPVPNVTGHVKASYL